MANVTAKKKDTTPQIEEKTPQTGLSVVFKKAWSVAQPVARVSARIAGGAAAAAPVIGLIAAEIGICEGIVAFAAVVPIAAPAVPIVIGGSVFVGVVAHQMIKKQRQQKISANAHP